MTMTPRYLLHWANTWLALALLFESGSIRLGLSWSRYYEMGHRVTEVNINIPVMLTFRISVAPGRLS